MALWDGLGFKSFDVIQTSFDLIDVAFDNTLIALFTRVQPPSAPTMVRVVNLATPTYTRV